MHNSSNTNCGIFELEEMGTNSARMCIETIFNDTYFDECYDWEDDGTYDEDKHRNGAFLHNRPPFVYFSTRTTESGPRLAAEIKKHKLGRVWGTPPRDNPSGSHDLRMWMWTPNAMAILKYLGRIRPRKRKGKRK